MPKKKKTKNKTDFKIIPFITMVISGLTLLFVLISVGYILYYTAVLTPIFQLAQNQMIIQQEIIDLTDEIKIADGDSDQGEVIQIRETNATDSWIDYFDNDLGIAIKYPKDFFHQEPKVTEISCKDVNFPRECPKIDQAVEVVTGSPIENSLAAGLPTSYYWHNPNGEKVMINNDSYCLYRHVEGAAGSTFVSYYYTTVSKNMCKVINLVVKYQNCSILGSKGDEDYEKCIMENEQTTPDVIDKVISTLEFN